MNEQELFNKWQANVCCLKRAHFHSANRFDRRNSLLGGALIFFSASASTAAYLGTKGDWQDWTDAVVPLLSLITTVLAGLQTYFRYSERSERHRAAGTNFAKIEMDLQSYLVPGGCPDKDMRTRLSSLKSQWVRTTSGAPLIPKDIHWEHCGHMEQTGCCGDEPPTGVP